jgi:hypothetical protein
MYLLISGTRALRHLGTTENLALAPRHLDQYYLGAKVPNYPNVVVVAGFSLRFYSHPEWRGYISLWCPSAQVPSYQVALLFNSFKKNSLPA